MSSEFFQSRESVLDGLRGSNEMANVAQPALLRSKFGALTVVYGSSGVPPAKG